MLATFVDWSDTYCCGVKLGSELYTIREMCLFARELLCLAGHTIVVLFDFGILSP